MPRKKAAGKTRGATSRALAGARPARKKVSAGRAARAVGQLAVLGTKIAAEKVKQTVARGRRLAGNEAARNVGKAVLKAGLAAAVTVTAEELARRGGGGD